MFVRLAKLIADIGGNAWFDAAGAQDKSGTIRREHYALADGDSPRRGHAREREVAETVNNRQRQNRPILAEPTRRPKSRRELAENRPQTQKMRVHVRFVLLHRRQHARLIQNVMRHENGQDRFHAVVGESLGRFVADNVGDTRRHAGHDSVVTSNICD